MKAWILSDLHIDWEPLVLAEHPQHDLIIMAGDLSDGDYSPVPWLLKTFTEGERRKMIFVPGNHEGYGVGLRTVPDQLSDLRKQCGIITLDRQCVELDGRRFVGCTMWSPLEDRLDDVVCDLAAIPDFNGTTWRRCHDRDRVWLEETVQSGDIVITHHAPSYDGLATEMQHNLQLASRSSGYYAPMESLITERRPALWVHGHTHIQSVYDVDGVPVASNARGRGWGHLFRPNFIIDIPEADGAARIHELRHS